MRRLLLMVWTMLLAAVCLALAGAPGASAAVDRLAGCTAQSLAANDDGSTTAVPTGGTIFHIGDTTYGTGAGGATRQIYVNNNGNISFGHASSDYTPYDFREGNTPIIAPYFADVDTRGTGSALTTYGMTTADGHPALCVLWDGVGYYSSHADKTNVFQMLLEDLGTAGVRVVFNYDRVQWETGDADGGDNGLGGTSAAAGFTTGEGDPLHALLLGGSFAPGAFLDGGPQSLAAGSNVGVPGRYVFTIDTVGSPGSRIAGVVKSTGGTPEGGAAVQACLASDPTNCVTRFADSTGAYRIRGLTTPGSYVLTAFSTGTEQPGTRTVSGVTGATGDNHTGQDITLGEPLHAPPDGTTVTNIGTQDGVPVLSWTQPITITTQGCTGGTGTYTVRVQGTVVSSGALTESPAGSGTFTATAPPTAPKHGNTEITTHITCPAGPPRDTDFGVYIDPSGVVIDQTGAPVSGAQVVLRRAGNADGPFFDVPDGSVVMSPSNRSNPVTTDATGVFHWDVVAGYYVVRATKDGCVSAADHSNPVASTPVMHVPPPATGLQLQLYCGPLTPAAPPASPPGSPAPAPTPPVVVTGAPPARALLVLGTAKLRKGRLAVQIRCASAAVGACAGSLTASVKRTTLGHRTFSRLKPGKSTTITLKLSRKARKALHAAAKKHRAKLTVSVTVHDAKGAGAVARRTLSVKA